MTPWSVRVVLVLLVLALAGCGGSTNTAASRTGDTGSTTSTTPHTAAHTSKAVQPPPAAPKPAECRNLSFSDTSSFSNATRTSPCTDPHTSYTLAVRQLPAAVAFKGVQIQNESVQSAAAQECRSAFVTFIGGDAETRALARLTVTYFLPSQKGFDLGAHWVRCDVVALQSAKSLADLPRTLSGLLDSGGALDRYGVCSRGDPGAPAAALVMCTQTHSYRAVAALRLGGDQAPYPGKGATLDAGKQRCQDLIAKQLHVSGGFTYGWTYPSTDDWAAGQRFGYCWNETSA